MAVMLPPPPSIARLREVGIRDDEYVPAAGGALVWRVHRTSGVHVVPWNDYRIHGPLLRFDQQPLPRGEHPGRGVWYGAIDVDTALAEAFQDTRVIDRQAGTPRLTAMRISATLLDVSGDHGAWPTRAGGNFALTSASRTRTQRWARTIDRAFPHVDGLRYRARWSGRPAIVLWQRDRRDPFPGEAEHSWLLSDQRLAGRIAAAADRLGYDVV
ncbi:RES family NAD+ phosphorylase [Tomitella gaofuii]|uniref:RES family NAD+ phosphorylase n=1 Tax=Tomitella gaofuii TaxID=2760083 RepID=UPI0015FDE053|nr:RES family NAD+ phosphorylase [Tomitella gaofuii]